MKYNKTKKKGKSKKTYVGGTEERVVVDVKKSFEIFIDDVVRSLFSNVICNPSIFFTLINKNIQEGNSSIY